MSFSFANRPSNLALAQRIMRSRGESERLQAQAQAHDVPAQTDESESDALRMFPLGTEAEPPSSPVRPDSHKPRRAVPVQPLSHRGHFGLGASPLPPMGPAHVMRAQQQGAMPPGPGPVSPMHARQSMPPSGPAHGHQAVGLGAPRMPSASPVPHHLPNATPLPPDANAANPQHQAQSAATQFRRINQGLPDGVHYEPLDEETLRILREMKPSGSEPGAGTDAVPVMPIPPTQTSESASPEPLMSVTPELVTTELPLSSTPSSPIRPNPAAIATLESLLQDERNAQIFYGHIADSASQDHVRNALLELARDCGARMAQYAALLARFGQTQFVPKETEINTRLDFAAGIDLALSEENRAIGVLVDLLEGINDPASEKTLQHIINKKIVNYQLKLRLRQNFVG